MAASLAPWSIWCDWCDLGRAPGRGGRGGGFVGGHSVTSGQRAGSLGGGGVIDAGVLKAAAPGEANIPPLSAIAAHAKLDNNSFVLNLGALSMHMTISVVGITDLVKITEHLSKSGWEPTTWTLHQSYTLPSLF